MLVGRRLLFLEHDSVVMHATCVTATTGVLSCATNTTVTHLDTASHLPCLFQPCDLLEESDTRTYHFFKDRFNNKLSFHTPLTRFFGVPAFMGQATQIFGVLPTYVVQPLKMVRLNSHRL